MIEFITAIVCAILAAYALYYLMTGNIREYKRDKERRKDYRSSAWINDKDKE